MQRGCFASRASITKMCCIELRGAFCPQGADPVDRRVFFAFTIDETALSPRFVPSKTMPVCRSIGAFSSTVQAFFAASGLTCLTVAVPVGSGGK
jgi:hypothetical protein